MTFNSKIAERLLLRDRYVVNERNRFVRRWLEKRVNRPYRLSRQQVEGVRRDLFGPVHQEENRLFLEENLTAQRNTEKERYLCDLQGETPNCVPGKSWIEKSCLDKNVYILGKQSGVRQAKITEYLPVMKDAESKLKLKRLEAPRNSS